jgi:RNA polymerase sigma factor (sigma-70 family)
MVENTLIKSILNGGKDKEQAVEYLINHHIGFIHKVHQNLDLPYDEAKDAYTDAILALIISIENQSFKGRSKISTYLYKVFYFKCIDLVRKNTTNQINYMEEIPDITASQMDVFKSFLIKDEVKNLKRYLDKLGEPCQQILLDWGFWGYKMPEIAERVGLENAGKAKRQKYNCLQKLLKNLKNLKG